MEQLLSGLYGALIATILSIVYLYFSRQIKLRFDVMLEVVGYCDDIYHRISMMHVHKNNMYTKKKPGLTDDEYRKLSQELTVLLKSSKVRAKVALVYGEGPVLEKFNELSVSFVEASSILRKATRAAWVVEENKKMNDIFEKRIDILRNQLEISLLKYARVNGVIRTLTFRYLPTFSGVLRLTNRK